MTFKIQVQVGVEWLDVRRYGGRYGGLPYLFDTRDEAERMMRMCYPDQAMLEPAIAVVRVVEVSMCTECSGTGEVDTGIGPLPCSCV